jgi:membrane-associated protease RseP (regulator of RpoE activity)
MSTGHPVGPGVADRDGPGEPDRRPGASTGTGWRQTVGDDPLGLAGHFEPSRRDEPPPGGSAWALLRLLGAIAFALILAALAGVEETVLLVLAFFICIVLHEFGHYITAKAGGIKVTEFFVGFGPRLWSVRHGETEYGVKGLPLGGYCRIIGMHNLEDVDPADEARTYRQAPLWRRLSVATAGSAMHFLIALCLLFSLFFFVGDNGNYLTTLPASSPITAIDGITVGGRPTQSPAEAAGFHIGDRVVSVDGRTFADYDDLRAFIEAHPGRRLDVVVRRDGHLVTLHPTPVNLATVKVEGASGLTAHKATGFLGIEVSGTVHSSLGASVSETGGAWVHVSALTLSALGRLVTFHGISSYFHMLGSQKAADNPTNQVRFESPVGVVRLFHQAGADGLATELWLLAIINISLGLFNLIPLLPLDGGHVAIALYEGVRSRRRRYHADVGKLLPLLYVSIALIAFLGVSSLFLDLRDLIN